jgi:hypothetical protein
MRASTQLIVPPTLRVKIALEMSVEEMRDLLDSTKDVRGWRISEFRNVLNASLARATDAYDSTLEIER